MGGRCCWHLNLVGRRRIKHSLHLLLFCSKLLPPENACPKRSSYQLLLHEIFNSSLIICSLAHFREALPKVSMLSPIIMMMMSTFLELSLLSSASIQNSCHFSDRLCFSLFSCYMQIPSHFVIPVLEPISSLQLSVPLSYCLQSNTN